MSIHRFNRFGRIALAVLILFAAAAVVKLYDQVIRREWKRTAGCLLILLISACLVNFRTPEIKKDKEITRPSFRWEWRGLTLMKEGETGAAREAFREALRLNPESYIAQYNLQLLKSPESGEEAISSQ